MFKSQSNIPIPKVKSLSRQTPVCRSATTSFALFSSKIVVAIPGLVVGLLSKIRFWNGSKFVAILHQMGHRDFYVGQAECCTYVIYCENPYVNYPALGGTSCGKKNYSPKIKRQ